MRPHPGRGRARALPGASTSSTSSASRPASRTWAGCRRASPSPRRPSPRTRVPAGSVAIGGSQTGVYPLASPGGWQLIGRTPLALFDPGRTPPALLAAGDRVRFVATEEATFLPPALDAVRDDAEDGDGRRHRGRRAGFPEHGPGPRTARLRPPRGVGVGRRRPSLAPDRQLAGRQPGGGGRDRDDADRRRPGVLGGLRRSGDRFRLRARDRRRPRPALDRPGGRAGPDPRVPRHDSGARCTVCVRGGVAAPLVLGSASTHLTSGIGGIAGRPLRAGDVLAIGTAAGGAPAGRRFPPEAAARLLRRDTLRVTRGPQWERFSRSARAALFASAYVVSESSSRMGLRLDGAPLAADRPGAMLTEGVSLGALQVPGDGRPIVSFVEHQTTGGYPQIACVIAADLHRVGQLRARDAVSVRRRSPSPRPTRRTPSSKPRCGRAWRARDGLASHAGLDSARSRPRSGGRSSPPCSGGCSTRWT